MNEQNTKTETEGSRKMQGYAAGASQEARTECNAGVSMGLGIAASERGGNCVEGQCSTVRIFPSGATRSPQGDKLQYEGYLNPLVLKRYAEYMQKHQTQSDGTRRSADNWQKNIDIESLCDSKVRHDMDSWLYFRGYSSETSEEIEDTLCACIFNTMAILKQVLEKRGRGKING